MKHKPRILIVLISAAITITSLIATVGKPPCYKHFKECTQIRNIPNSVKEN